ncbi:external NADH-ubiquinone oxidoreductase 1 [Diaporthe amygdali]|uniref:external NADH-ubiquinone oxidoreductase 1 n=1 Tax=Phomopsis amygdali TaxID=1214568 RepID=UPI0022FE4738|nr:external NADH-ubiquinone oxidoreductase 1 [Diaporthe amygdali]KAJ0118460.1 external NADH-ubiquinone oxidoreductase 1 [Diaporthe amygdali]
MASSLTKSTTARLVTQSTLSIARRSECARCFATSVESSKAACAHRWAGYAFARKLDPAKYERIIISPRSYFVFTPLLASTSVGTLEFRTILESVRRLGDVEFHQGWADDIDFSRKLIRVEENQADDLSSQTILPPPKKNPESNEIQVEPPQIPKGPVMNVGYDKLVIAVGAYSQTFGIDGVRQHAHFLRDIGDARRVRLRVLSLFEQCSSPTISEENRHKLLHFAVVGGGPTGIEFAAELHDLIHDDLSKIYPDLVKYAKITVYDISPKILPMFDQALASYAMRAIQKQNIDIKTAHTIQRVRPDTDSTGGLKIKIKEYGDEEVGAGIVVWSTGLMQNPLIEKLMSKSLSGALPVEGQEAPREFRLERDSKTGGIITDGRFRAQLADSTALKGDNTATNGPAAGLQTQILNDVFVIGDCAVISDQPTLPKTAQVASQEASYLAKALNKGSMEEEKPFAFRNLGTMTYLGNWKALFQGTSGDLTGFMAWVLWRGAYLTKSMSWKNKLLIPVYWFVSWVFGRDISRF